MNRLRTRSSQTPQLDWHERILVVAVIFLVILVGSRHPEAIPIPSSQEEITIQSPQGLETKMGDAIIEAYEKSRPPL